MWVPSTTPTKAAASTPPAQKSRASRAAGGGGGHLLGYARVHRRREPVLQLDALAAAGVTRVYTDHASGALDRRPELCSMSAALLR